MGTHKGFTALMFAAQQGRSPAVRILLTGDPPADVTARTFPDRLNLKWPSATVNACTNCRTMPTDMVQRLNLQKPLAADSAPSQPCSNKVLCASCLAGYTAIDFAAQRGHTEVVNLFNELDAPSPEALALVEAAEGKTKKGKRNVSATRGRKDTDHSDAGSSVSGVNSDNKKQSTKAKGKK